MDFLIADTFTASLARLTAEEQKAVKTTAFDLQLNPASPGMNFHKLAKAKDRNFWSVRVNADIRLIVHRSANSLMLCYVAHHDKAYDWAERRKIETHPKTGAAQIVEIRESVQEIVVPLLVQRKIPDRPKPLPFADRTDEELLAYGVPSDWLADVRKADEDSILTIADHLPAEAAEALLEIATGGTPKIRQAAAPNVEAFEHPDAQRRFRVVTSSAELERAFEYPWDQWTVFLHPDQRDWVQRDFSGPARVSGTAGTGKTIVALHRAVHLARENPDSRVLLATFSDPLASALSERLRRLISHEPRLADRIDVSSLDSVAVRLHRAQIGLARLATDADVNAAIAHAAEFVGAKHSLSFLRSEWRHVVDAWNLTSWDAYRDVVRLGRKTKLREAQREILWKVFQQTRATLRAKSLMTLAEVYGALAAAISKSKHPPYEFAVIDEAQDIAVAQLQFLAAMGGSRANSLFFAGDLGQRIFQQPFSWRSLGVDVRGRSRILQVNYRTSHQIRQQADRLLGPEIADIDGAVESRLGTVSIFNGPKPEVMTFESAAQEIDAVAQWIKKQIESGVAPHEIGVFVRSPAEIERAERAVTQAGQPFKVLDARVGTTSGMLSIGSMHLAKGLEFKSVAVMACDDEILPLQQRIQDVGDDSDLKEVYDTERHLLYVACTRARENLLVASVVPASEFLDDLSRAR
jgi:superfamily I DNA/RNA helicase/mRNA-degrading endonuclease RelE of RelBE toxin-antitoxin system